MSRSTVREPKVDERSRASFSDPPRNDGVPAAHTKSNNYDDQQQQRKKSAVPSGKTSELLGTDQDLQESNQSERERERERDEEKLKKLQRKVNLKMALGRLRRAVRQQDERAIKTELDEVEKLYPESLKSSGVDEAKVLLQILEAARDLKNWCDQKNVDEINKTIGKIERNGDKRFQEMLQSQVREARYVVEELTKPPVRKNGRLQVDSHAFNELRRYVKPPPGVLPTMQAVFLLLGVDEGRTETWPDVQRLCKPNGPKNLYNQVLNLHVNLVEPELAARARDIIQFGKDYRLKKKGKKATTERDQGTSKSEDLPAQQSKTTAKSPEKFETAYNDRKLDDSAATMKETRKEPTAENKTGGIDSERLRTTCPVAWTLLLWALDVVKKVELLHGKDKMIPADLKRQQEILQIRLPKLPKMDRQYYHILAKNSMAPSYQQQYGTGYSGEQTYRNTSPSRRQNHAREHDYDLSSPRRQDDADDYVTWRPSHGVGNRRYGQYYSSHDQYSEGEEY